MKASEKILGYLNDQDEKLSYVAKEIWDHPEIALEETFASRLLSEELENAGFAVERGVGQMPTAFVATWGEGKPIVGFLGEYDALPGLSQNLSTEVDPIVNGGPGHGCGHNLFGTACLGAALSLKTIMETEQIPGTIRYYGCPAEETLVGKTFMARDGVFDDLDAALGWHPGSVNVVWAGSSLAMNSFKVNFHGRASHAGVAPELGRSALDGAMLMDVGVNYLREHIIQEARIHSVITSGGQAPNVVPAYAQIWYFVRAPRREQVEAIYARMLDIAKGAALMSGTTHDIDFVTGCYELLSNSVISNIMLEKMQEIDDLRFTDQERAFAKQLQETFPDGSVNHEFDKIEEGTTLTLDPTAVENPLWEDVLPHVPNPGTSSGSTEVADVSRITPTGQLRTCCWPLGTPPHSWQTVASSGSSIGFKGMLFAAKALALTSLELMTKPSVLAAARKEFEQAQRGKAYVSPLPKDTIPH
ncbi:amidohydrolase [Chloroflexi bacterium TSY]|nr:amidohydrolase [Chloroflexi bacterium TSY]